MNLKIVLRKNNFLLFLLACLILIGFFYYYFRKPGVSILNTPSPTPVNIRFENARVTKVFDGDTIQIDNGDKVRYIGVDSGEVYPITECYSQEEKRENEKLVLGRDVKLVKDTSETDKYGRLLRYVYVEDIFVNDLLVKTGYAKVMTVPPDTKFQNLLVESEKYAKENHLGLWGKCGEE